MNLHSTCSRRPARHILIPFAALAAGTAPAAAQSFTMSWNTIDGGGGVVSGGGYTLSGTIGQADAATHSAAPVTALDGGFWGAPSGTAPVCYPDCDTSSGPGVLDIFDFLCFQNHFSLNNPYACDCDTSSGPEVCDIFDFLCFQNAYSDGCP